MGYRLSGLDFSIFLGGYVRFCLFVYFFLIFFIYRLGVFCSLLLFFLFGFESSCISQKRSLF